MEVAFLKFKEIFGALPCQICVSVHQCMQEITKTTRKSREQNQEIGPSRVSHNWKDTKTVAAFFKDRDPFSYGNVLCNIANGVNAHPSTNVENAKSIGTDIVNKREDVKVTEYTFKRKDQAVTLATKAAVKIDGDSIQVDTQLLFQRLIVAAKLLWNMHYPKIFV